MTEAGDREALRGGLRTAWHRYVDALVPLRPGLHAYCRRLAGNLWDAEDLVQDTLLRAFAQWGVSYGDVRNPRAYLLRIATNVWIDTLRRRQTEDRATATDPAAVAATSTTPPTPAPGELSEAGARLLERLSPQEQAALVLKEGFDMTLEEIAGLLATTTGAVKAALHRGRERLREPEGRAASRRREPSRELVDRFVDCCRAGDVQALLALMLDGATAENLGNSVHVGSDPAEGYPRFIRAVIHGHPEWPAQLQPESERMERVELDGEPMVLAFRRYAGSDEALTTVFRFEEEAGRIARVRSYAFCPETIRAVGERLGVPVLTGLYRAPTPAPGEEWPERP